MAIYTALELLNELKEMKRKGADLDNLNIMVVSENAEYDIGVAMDIEENEVEVEQLVIRVLVS